MISQKKAIQLAIKTLTDWRRRHYAMGEEAFKKGIDFTFAVDGHKHYVEYSQAIRQLEDLLEITEDLKNNPVLVDETAEETDLTGLPLFDLRDSARTEAGGC